MPFPSSLNRSGLRHHLLKSLKLISSLHSHFLNTEFSRGGWLRESRAVRHEEKGKKQSLKVLKKEAACGVHRQPQVHCCSPSSLSKLAHQYCSTCHSQCLGIKLQYLLRAESQERLHDNQQPQGTFPDDLFLTIKLLYFLIWEEGGPGHNT